MAASIVSLISLAVSLVSLYLARRNCLDSARAAADARVRLVDMPSGVLRFESPKVTDEQVHKIARLAPGVVTHGCSPSGLP